MQEKCWCALFVAVGLTAVEISAQAWLTTSSRLGAGRQVVRDDARQRWVLFDGKTWEWEGADWVERKVTNPPVYDGAMAFDPVSQRTILFGGFDRTFSWDGIPLDGVVPGESPAGANLRIDGRRRCAPPDLDVRR